MIRKLARMQAPREVVYEMFRDTDEWPRWMPGIASTRTLSEDRDSRLVEVIYLVHGRRFEQHLECRETPEGLEHRQVKGWFRSWEAEWTFQETPRGGGTTVSIALALELGLAAGLLLPRRMLRGWMSRLLDDTLAQGRSRAVRLAGRRHDPTRPVDMGQPLLQVFQTPEGFEVCFAGRIFLIDSARVSEKH